MKILPQLFPQDAPRGRCLLTALLAFATSALIAAEPSAERVKEIAAWLPAQPASFTEPITDRAAWAARARQIEFTNVIADATALAANPIPAPDDSLYLEFTTIGNRARFEKVEFARRGGVGIFTLAECIENKGRFLAPLEALIASICAEKTWVWSAHDRALKNFRGEIVEIDLGVANFAWCLATADALLGDKLSPSTRALIRENLQRRVFQPFRSAVTENKPIYWMDFQFNWNAVCLAGTTGAALATLDKPEDRAWFIAATEIYIRNFLSGFTPDGYCSEGVGYWNYGFGHFTMLAETIRRSTGGKIDWLTDPAAISPAFYGARTEILAGIYPSIADAEPGIEPGERLMALLSDRFGFPVNQREPAKADAARRFYESLILTRSAVAAPKIPAPALLQDLNLRTWFPDGGVLIGRPGSPTNPPFAACIKGGSNHEFHNHNDVGTFMVVGGKTMLVCDPGKEVYTASTFGSKRYDSKVNGSYGHPVPLIAGQQQHDGAKTDAVLLASDFTPDQDRVKFDLRAAYAVPALHTLEREFIFRRGSAAALIVTDTVKFSTPSTYEGALLTWGKWERISPTEIRISDGADAIRVTVDSGGQAFELQAETLNEDVLTRVKPIRLGFKVTAPVEQLKFKLTIVPERR